MTHSILAPTFIVYVFALQTHVLFDIYQLALESKQEHIFEFIYQTELISVHMHVVESKTAVDPDVHKLH